MSAEKRAIRTLGSDMSNRGRLGYYDPRPLKPTEVIVLPSGMSNAEREGKLPIKVIETSSRM